MDQPQGQTVGHRSKHGSILLDTGGCGKSDDPSTHDMHATTPLGEGGSIVLIDPTTDGIIGTLTPASPEMIGRSIPTGPDERTTETEGDAAIDIPDEPTTEPKRNRRDSIYTYRLSFSDVSLRTYRPGQGSDDGLPQISAFSLAADLTGPETGGLTPKGDKSRIRGSWMTDDASFWTARGTLRVDEGGEEGKEREVMVAFVKADKDLDDLFSSYMPSPLADRTSPKPTLIASPSSHDTLRPAAHAASRLTTATSTTDSPFPSRILHLFPRLSTLPRGGDSSGSGLPTSASGSLVWPGLGLEGMDPASLVASAQNHAEAAFWRLIMPGISGLYGWSGLLGSAYQHLASYKPFTFLQSSSPIATSAPLLIDSDPVSGTYTPRLYSDETIYTLRLPASATNSADTGLGPTLRPVWVKKRSALPVFGAREDGWGREIAAYR